MTVSANGRWQEYDDELYVRGRTVVWTAGLGDGTSSLRRAYTAETTVLQALWCGFGRDPHAHGGARDTAADGGGASPGTLCIVEASCLTFYEGTGAVFSVPTPFAVRCVLALPAGLLVARADTQHADPSAPAEPLLFSLLHPLEELKPVAWDPFGVGSGGGGGGHDAPRYIDHCFIPQRPRSGCPLVALYSPRDCQLSLCLMRRHEVTDLDSAVPGGLSTLLPALFLTPLWTRDCTAGGPPSCCFSYGGYGLPPGSSELFMFVFPTEQVLHIVEVAAANGVSGLRDARSVRSIAAADAAPVDALCPWMAAAATGDKENSGGGPGRVGDLTGHSQPR